MGGRKDVNTGCNEMVILSSDRKKWIKLNMKLPNEFHSGNAIYLNEEIYLFGGYNYCNELNKLDKNLNWIRLADMNFGRKYMGNCSFEWNGCIWVFGGLGTGGCLKSVERYDPKEDKWTKMPDMKNARLLAASAVLNGKFIISGGAIDLGHGRTINSVECFNPQNNRWMELPGMPEPLAGHTFIFYKNKLLSLGGEDKNCKRRCDVWQVDHHGNKWNPLPPMKYPVDSFASGVLDDEIYVIGGYDEANDIHARVQIFNGEEWRDGPSLPSPLSDMAFVVIPQDLADRLCNYKPE